MSPDLQMIQDKSIPYKTTSRRQLKFKTTCKCTEIHTLRFIHEAYISYKTHQRQDRYTVQIENIYTRNEPINYTNPQTLRFNMKHTTHTHTKYLMGCG